MVNIQEPAQDAVLLSQNAERAAADQTLTIRVPFFLILAILLDQPGKKRSLM